ncbi:MAG: ABC transporter permease [Actinomycetota bacterium]|nr:ABC transporter permease [Actinomycetota bacterium]
MKLIALIKGKATPARTLLFAGVLFLLLSLARVISDGGDLTSSHTMGATLRVTCPILLAGLAGLWAERAGIVNIGIEGMMIFGTWFGGWGAWKYGPWVGLLLAIIAGSIGGLIHAFAVVQFNVNHVISGVAMNLFAFGAMRYMSELVYTKDVPGAGISQSPQQKWPIPRVNLPFLAGGDLFGWRTPDSLGWLEQHKWFAIGDLAGILRGVAYNVSWASLLVLLLVPVSAWVLWRTRFGLRLRSSGEAPAAAESLGVKVTPLRYAAMAISGGFAGLGGGFLAIISSSYYRQGQTANRGFIGLATNIAGNWRPVGVLASAALFGFAEALQLVGADSLPKLFLFLTFACGMGLLVSLVRKKLVPAINAVVAGALFLWVYLAVNEVPEPLTKAAPYMLTLIVLTTASQRLRPPAYAGMPYRSGESH